MTALAGLAVPRIALAQGVALIGNLDEGSNSGVELDRAHGQKFQTGSVAGGYEIGSVQIPITKSAGTRGVTVDLRSDGLPLTNNVIFTFDGPSAISTGTNTYTFTVPAGAEATLEPSKNYWVVAEQTGGSGENLRWPQTRSNDEAGLQGMSLDENHARQNSPTYWPIGIGFALKLRVNGLPQIITVEDVRVVSTAPAVGFYRTGEEIEVDVEFPVPVRFRDPADSDDGNLSLWFDGTDPARFGGAKYRSGSGTDTIRYAYTVRSDDLDPDGLTVGAKQDDGIGDFVPVSSLPAVTVDESYGARSDLAAHRVNGPMPQGGGPGSGLVSNLGQGVDSQGTAIGEARAAQPFTTGNNQAGYTLTRVSVSVSVRSGGPGRFSAAIYTVDSSGYPDNEVATLSAPSSFGGPGGDRTITFTAPADTILMPETTCTVRMRGASFSAVRDTVSSNEDPGAAPGWTIGNTGQLHSRGRWGPNEHGQSFLIAIDGLIGENSPAITGNAVAGETRTGETLSADTSGIADCPDLGGSDKRSRAALGPSRCTGTRERCRFRGGSKT